MTRNIDFLFLIGPRACGKSSVGEQLARRLKNWQFIDLDSEYQRRFPSLKATPFAHDPEQYYHGSNAILRETLHASKVILALGGGTLLPAGQAPSEAEKIISLCHNRGDMVLILPSRFDWRNRRILKQRELQRDYHISRNLQNRKSLAHTVIDSYNTRIDFYRAQADLRVYSCDPERCACKLIRMLNLQ